MRPAPNPDVRRGAPAGAGAPRPILRSGLGIAGALGGLAIMLQALQAAIDQFTPPRVLSFGLIALSAAVAVGAWLGDQAQRNREQAAALREDEERRARERAAWEERAGVLLRLWPLGTVREAGPFALGIRLSEIAQRSAESGALPPYVERAVDGDLRQALRDHRFVLLKGGVYAGKTRTAYEAARAVYGGRTLIAPNHDEPSALPQLLDELRLLDELGDRPALLWLDNLDRHLTGGLTSPRLAALRRRRPGLAAVATISDHRYGEFLASHEDVLREFHLVSLPRDTEAELRRAAELYPDADFGDSIAGYFMSERQLLHRLRAGSTDCPFERGLRECNVARALIDAAVDWAGTGLSLKPIAARDLERLCAAYTIGVTTEHFEAALRWATAEIAAGVALVHEIEGGTERHVYASDLVVQWLGRAEDGRRRRIADAAWAFALERASGMEAVMVGLTAALRGHHEVGDRAWAKAAEADNPLALPLLALSASLSLDRSRFDQAHALYERSLALEEAAYGTDDPHLVNTLRGLGKALAGLGRLREACAAVERALRIQERLSVPEADLARTLRQLARAQVDLGRPTEARGHLERALLIQERLGASEEDLSETLRQLAVLLDDLGQPREARAHLERILQMREAAHGPDHPKVAGTLDSLGNVFQTLGDAERAYELHQRALAIAKAAYGPAGQIVGGILNNLGNAADGLGRFTEARGHLLRSLAIKRRIHGIDHPEFATTLCNLAVVMRHSGDLEQAREYYERALAIQEQIFGGPHPSIAITLNNLATLLEKLGEPETARRHLERALDIWLRVYGPDHPDVGLVRNNLGALLGKLGHEEEAARHLWRALRAFRVSLGPRHPWTNGARRNLYPYVLRALDRVSARLSFDRPLTSAQEALAYASPALERLADRDGGGRSIDWSPASDERAEPQAS